MKFNKITLSSLPRVAVLCLMCLAAALQAAAYTVVIDAGHGGKDHGAIDNGMREKDINLAVALRLAKLLHKHDKDLKVILTRDKDVYLTLQQRADIANRAHGDLFISIHTNSVAESNPNRTTVAGASTYTLGLHKDAANMEVARRENNVMTYESNYGTKYSGFDPNSDESYIIFEMAQKSNMAQSVKFANAVQRQMGKVASRKDRGVHQAGFWVLWATSMPAALVELDFICNPNSAKFMGSERGQDQLAKALCNAVTEYFTALAKHEKERLRTDADTPVRNEDTAPTSEAPVVVLEAAVPVERKSSDAPAAVSPAERTRRPATRRRRSESARQKSCEQEYDVAVIPEEVQYVAIAEPEPQPSAAPAPEPQPAPATNKKGKAKKQKKSKTSTPKATPATAGNAPVARTVGGKTVYIVASTPTAAESQAPQHEEADSPSPQEQMQVAQTQPAPAKKKKAEPAHSAPSSSPARMARVNTVYKIQIYSCDKILKEKDPLFGGLYPVTCSKTADNIYTYYYGESSNQGEIYRLLSDVKKLFPEAKVVKARRQ